MSKLVWTNHLRERIRQRGLDPRWVESAINFPDEVVQSSTTDSKKYIKTIQGYKIVAAVKKDMGNWIITSAWHDQPGNYHRPKTKKLFFEQWVENFIRWIEKKITSRRQ